jgi:arsenate reductase (glutaredoxin)
MPKKQTQAVCTLYHNPRCSKSRTTLALLQDRGVDVKVVDYLQNPPTVKDLKSVLSKLNLRPEALLRTGEEEFRSKVAGKKLTDAQLIAVMVDNPILIERPIAVVGERAAIGRPPENVLSLLK